MSQKLRDWRGSTTRFLEGNDLVETPLSESIPEMMKTISPDSVSRLCENHYPDGSVKCRFLTSALSRWRMFIPDHVSRNFGAKNVGMAALKTGVNRGQAIGVLLIATCQECKRRKKLSITLSTESLPALSSKNLVLSPPEGIFISWRMEISNSFKSGGWEKFD